MSIISLKASLRASMAAVIVLGVVATSANAQNRSLQDLVNSIPGRNMPAAQMPVDSPNADAVEAVAEEVMVIDMTLTDANGAGASVGMVTAENTQYGLLLTPELSGLTAGIHGFHVHQNPACGPGEKDGETVPGLAAGGHYDPTGTEAHEGPYGEGHLGDLPPLYVDDAGMAMTPILAPRLTTEDIVGRSLMIHMMGDNFSDEPAPLGGGGGRLACGVI